MSDIKFRKDLAEYFGIHEKTLQKKLNELQIKYPSNSSLFRFIGKKQFFTDNDFREIIELCSEPLKEKTENHHITT
tara:strand:- start:4286 stop:4513 length:228 start_codon:yes stop_codon:yes gene_type:complete